MSNLFYLPRVHSQPGAKLYFRVTGTSTPQNTYTDIDLTVPSANPLTADADGYFDKIYLDPSLPDYRVIHTDGSNVDDDPTLELELEPTLDDIPSSSNVSTTYRAKGTNPTFFFEETDASTNHKKWRIRVNAETLTIDAGDDAESSWTPLLSISRTDPIIDRGTFTATVTGFASNITGTINYQRQGNLVSLWAKSSITSISDKNTMTMTGLPASLRPTFASESAVHMVRDNSLFLPVVADISATSDTVTFARVTSLTASASSTGFTTSNIKGIPAGWFMQYAVS